MPSNFKEAVGALLDNKSPIEITSFEVGLQEDIEGASKSVKDTVSKQKTLWRCKSPLLRETNLRRKSPGTCTSGAVLLTFQWFLVRDSALMVVHIAIADINSSFS